MENEETQVNNQMNPDQVLSSLAFTNNLQKQRLEEEMLMSQAQQQATETPQTPESAPEQNLNLEQEETPPIDPEALKADITNDVTKELKKEMKTIIRSELKKLLDEDDEDKTAEDTE